MHAPARQLGFVTASGGAKYQTVVEYVPPPRYEGGKLIVPEETYPRRIVGQPDTFSDSTVTDWLRENQTAVMVGAAALFALALISALKR